MASRISIATGIALLYAVSMVCGETPAPAPAGAASCTSVNTKLFPCLGFIESDLVKKPSGSCCRSMASLAATAASAEDRVAVCNCLKKRLAKLKGKVIEERVMGLPKMCAVAMKMPPFDESFDCSTWSV